MCLGGNGQQQGNTLSQNPQAQGAIQQAQQALASGQQGPTGNQAQAQSLNSAMRKAVMPSAGQVDMNAYQAYAQEMSNKGVRPLSPQQWAIVNQSSNVRG